MSLAVTIVWVISIIAMGIAYAVIMSEKPNGEKNTSEPMEEMEPEKETTEIK